MNAQNNFMLTHDIRCIRNIHTTVIAEGNSHRIRFLNRNLTVIFDKLIPRNGQRIRLTAPNIQSQNDIRTIILITFIPISQDQLNSLSRSNCNAIGFIPLFNYKLP